MSRSAASVMIFRAPSTCSPRKNPIEQEGTYPLPEAQLDRFLLQIDVDYPDRTAERRILLETTGESEVRPRGRTRRRRI